MRENQQNKAKTCKIDTVDDFVNELEKTKQNWEMNEKFNITFGGKERKNSQYLKVTMSWDKSGDNFSKRMHIKEDIILDENSASSFEQLIVRVSI